MKKTKAEWLAESQGELGRYLDVIGSAGELVVEVRALEVPRDYGSPITEYGFFPLPEGRSKLWDVVKAYISKPSAQQPEGVYVTPNPLNPALLVRANQRMKAAGKKAGPATDADVLVRRWLVIDVDPVRPAGISASDGEKSAAWEVAEAVRADLAARRWPAPAVVDSGNGFHLYYRVDLPSDDGCLTQRCLKSLAATHNTDRAKVDTSCFNPARIFKLVGTLARKGDATTDRPYRRACVLEVPG